MQGAVSKRIRLFALLFGVPLLFLYLLAKGNPNTTSLKYYGKEITEIGKQKINDFLFYDVDSNEITQQTLKGKTIITSILIPSCPSYCPVISQQIDEFLYKKIIDRENFKDFIILSQLIDTTGKNPNLVSFINEQDIKPNKWLIVTGNENPIYNFELPNANLLQDNITDKAIGGRTYYKMLILIDKNKYVRGIYQGDKTLEIERLNKEIRVLEREYHKEAKN
jgi:protein SCO1/2